MEINQVITEPFWVIKAVIIKADHTNLHQVQWFFKLNFNFDHSTIFIVKYVANWLLRQHTM